MNKDNTKAGPNRTKKIAIVAELNVKVSKATAIVMTDYTGLTHKQLEGFKKEIKKADADFFVTKNTLLKRSLEENKLETGDKTNFDQPTGTLFAYGDVVLPLKALAKMIKEFEKPRIKFGLLDGHLLDAAAILKLSTLPSKETLLTQLVGLLNSPIQGLHTALQWNLKKFVLTLNAVAKSKPQV